jgi:hypothetical protein
MEAAMSERRHLSLYSGRELLGTIDVQDDTYCARLADRRQLANFASLREATDAIAYACGRPVERVHG